MLPRHKQKLSLKDPARRPEPRTRTPGEHAVTPTGTPRKAPPRRDGVNGGAEPGFNSLGTPQDLVRRLETVGYQCLPYLAIEIGLLLATPADRVRAALLEGPSGCGKSFLAKCLAQISGAELMCLSCYQGMPTANLIESPSTLALANAMARGGADDPEQLMNLGILSRAFLKSQERPVILLVDELDKPDAAIDTFFLGPIQDARIWLESRAPIDANSKNLLILFTKNFNRPLDDALLRRCHPIRMTYLDSTLERKILSPHCHPQLVANLVGVADRMRYSGGSYAFDRPPAPEELLTAGQYVMKLAEWGFLDFEVIGKSVWNIMAKSEHDRAVLEHMLRYHPDYIDPLVPDAKNAPLSEIYARFGRVILEGLVEDPDAERRRHAWDRDMVEP
jgi:energy-coupling factor transporter ATP-binding protein EcfA2